MKEKILVSKCLLGCDCRYDGKNSFSKSVDSLKENYDIVAICPEQAGGLSTPRPASEIIDNKVYFKTGKDVSFEFSQGANQALKLAKKHNIKKAVLKEASPSCGVNVIYDGTFSGKKIAGQGWTTQLLLEHGILCYSEDDIIDKR